MYVSSVKSLAEVCFLGEVTISHVYACNLAHYIVQVISSVNKIKCSQAAGTLVNQFYKFLVNLRVNVPSNPQKNNGLESC